MSERPDGDHVGVPEQPVWLHEDGHLASVATGSLRDEADVHDPVHGLVRDLGRKLVVGHVQRGEGERRELRAGALA